VLEDIRNTSFADSLFDAVYAVSTLEHLGLSGRYGVTQEDLEGDVKALKEIGRILRPGGTLLCTVPFGREAKVIKPLQRVYDRLSLERLFRDWLKKDEVYYYQNSDGWWLPISRENVVLMGNPTGDSVTATSK
jgi:predicted SAM-dependent methyltransferase